MSKTGAIRQGRAFVELFTDDTELTRGLRRAEKSVERFGANVSSIGGKMMKAGGAIAAPLVAGVAAFVKVGAELQEMSERTGIAVESLSALKYAASQTGASMEALEKGIRISQKLAGSSIGAKTLSGLGIDVEKLKKLSPEDQFMALVETVSKIPAQADRVAAAMKVFGKAGAGLLPFINEGREGIAKLRGEAEKLGLVMSGEDAAAAHKLENSMLRVKQQFVHTSAVVGAALAPALEWAAMAFSRTVASAKAFVEKNRDVIVHGARAAAAMLAAGAAVWGLGKAFALASVAIGATRVVVSMLIPLFTGGHKIITMVAGGVTALRAAITSARVAVLGLASAGGIANAIIAMWPALILAALAALMYFSGGFKEIGNVFRQVWGGMGDAISAGNIELAMKIMWAGVKLLWTEGVNFLLNYFASMGTTLLKILATVSGVLLVGVMTLTEGIHWLWTELWTRVANGWTETWSRLKTGIIAAKKWLHLLTDEEAQIAIKAEIDERTKTIDDRKRVRAEAHAEDRQRTNDAVKALENNLSALQKNNDKVVAMRDAETEARRQELAQLRAEAARQKAAAAAGWTMPGMKRPGIPDITSSVEKAYSVVGAFDIGALMSLQAGERDNYQERIATSSEESRDLLQQIRDEGASMWGS